ncbi:immunity 49 family protein [Streptomyces sp. NPDC048057]|uniref:immunity 49 family protein n=1 Tax=Streptomyces sp. NPDC048057 TaxID=3155628 RepID=UPI0033DD62A2
MATSMWIERHEVGQAALSRALDGFAERMAGDVHMMQHDELPAYGWEMIAESFLDYLGARSTVHADLTDKDARVACESAATAGVGALALRAGRAGHPHVFIDYTGTGIVYDGSRPPENPDGVAAHVWLDAFFPAFVANASDAFGELFVASAVPLADRESEPDVALVHALMVFVYGIGDDGTDSDAARSARIDEIAAAVADGKDWPSCRAALTTLQALAAGDRAAFTRALAAQLERHAAAGTPERNPAPRTLLPMDAIALAAMAVRWQEWPLEVESRYLPIGPVSGFRPPEPRVLAYGRKKHPDAVAALAAGPLVIERPEHPYARNVEPLLFGKYAERALAAFRDPDEDPADVARRLHSLMDDHLSLFLERAASDPECRDPQQRGLLHIATEAGAGVLRMLRAEKGAQLSVTVAGTTRDLPATRHAYPHVQHWLRTLSLSLVTGDREALAACVTVEPEFLVSGRHFAPTNAYGAALHDYLRGADPEPAVNTAFEVCFRHERGTYLAPPVHLLSQVVEGDREGFALALADALEKHRDHYAMGELSEQSEAVLDLNVLALVCHVRRMGWEVPVVSPYVPQGVVTPEALVG